MLGADVSVTRMLSMWRENKGAVLRNGLTSLADGHPLNVYDVILAFFPGG